MRTKPVGSLLSLVRQGLALEVSFGTHSIEALLWVAETVEEAVYRPRSMVRGPRGIEFELCNPPLRLGAFRAVRVSLDGRPVPAQALRIRIGPSILWREATSVSDAVPIDLVPGEPIRFAVDTTAPPVGRRLTVRVELDSVAIPPLVWLEFADELREGTLP